MKKFLHLLLLIFCCVAGGGVAVTADTTPVLINEDRVWEYLLDDYPRGYIGMWDKTWTRYKFEGTEEKYGKEYARLMRISRVVSSFNLTEGKLLYPVTDDTEECVAYLREEDGKVYLLIEEESINYMNLDYPGWKSPHNAPLRLTKNVVPGEEVLLYDFSCSPGDVAWYWTNFLPTKSHSTWKDEILVPEMTISVEEEEYPPLGTLKHVTLQNGLFTIMGTGGSLLNPKGEIEFCTDPAEMTVWQPECIYSEYIEGIGNIGYGNLITVGTMGYVDGITGPGHYEERLNNVYDLEGNIIYEGLNMSVPYPKMLINSDRVWEYAETGSSGMSGQFVTTVSRYQFKDTEEIDGKNYDKLYHIYSATWTSERGHVISPVEQHDYDEVVAYMREEEGKVYVLAHRPQVPEYKGADNYFQIIDAYISQSGIWTPGPESREYLVYDFSSVEGTQENFLFLCQPNGSNTERWEVETPCRIWEREQVEVPGLGNMWMVRVKNGLMTACATGKPLLMEDGNLDFSGEYKYGSGEKYENLTYTTVLEGVGNLSNGTLWQVGTSGFYAQASDGSDPREIRLNNLYDLEGNVLYRGLDKEVPDVNSVGGIAEEADGASAMFDLMGRRIAKPLPGTVYIRGGRKFVAR